MFQFFCFLAVALLGWNVLWGCDSPPKSLIKGLRKLKKKKMQNTALRLLGCWVVLTWTPVEARKKGWGWIFCLKIFKVFEFVYRFFQYCISMNKILYIKNFLNFTIFNSHTFVFSIFCIFTTLYFHSLVFWQIAIFIILFFPQFNYAQQGECILLDKFMVLQI